MSKTPARYIVKTQDYIGIGRKPLMPHKVVDTVTHQILDEYCSKRAAQMHVRDLNQADRKESK